MKIIFDYPRDWREALNGLLGVGIYSPYNWEGEKGTHIFMEILGYSVTVKVM